MRHFFKIAVAVSALAGLALACHKEQDVVGWEPEVAAPLATFTIDLNKQIDMAEYSRSYFGAVSPDKQNELLYTAISEGLDDSVRRRLPRYLRENIDTFVYRREHTRPIPEFMALTLLMDMLDNFERNSSITAINSFAYYILSGLPEDLQRSIKDSLYHYPLDVYENLGLDMSAITNRSEFLYWLRLQMSVRTRLGARALMQVYLRDSSNITYDSIFRIDPSGAHEGTMPFADNASGEYRQHVLREYMEAEVARKTIDVHSIAIRIRSDSLCLDTSLVWLKDLHNRKIHTSVGMMFKMNMDDTLER